MFKEFSLGCIAVSSSPIQKNRKISQNSHSLWLAVIYCHLLSLIVPLVVSRCTTRCHLFSLICCKSLYHSLLLVVTRTPCLSNPAEFTPESSPMKICSVNHFPGKKRFLPPRQIRRQMINFDKPLKMMWYGSDAKSRQDVLFI